jgi:hypothetical protein
MNHSEALAGEAIESIADDTLHNVAVDAAQRGTDAMHPAVAHPRGRRLAEWPITQRRP